MGAERDGTAAGTAARVTLVAGDAAWDAGDGEALHALFSTIAVRLGAERFPVLLGPLYDGELPSRLLDAARGELASARRGLRGRPPAELVWDMHHLSVRPPWGGRVSAAADVVALLRGPDGRPLLDVLDEALRAARRARVPLAIRAGDGRPEVALRVATMLYAIGEAWRVDAAIAHLSATEGASPLAGLLRRLHEGVPAEDAAAARALVAAAPAPLRDDCDLRTAAGWPLLALVEQGLDWAARCGGTARIEPLRTRPAR